MKPTTLNTMEETLKTINNSLKSFNKKVNIFIAASIAVMIFVLTINTETRVEVVKKADAAEIHQYFVTKQDALNIHNLEEAYTKELIRAVIDGDTTHIDPTNYKWIVEGILDMNYRGIQ